ncbi:hypothetical protein [Ottowia sp.]|uniref:hypothetical protein n=1 Tax=Ottowia sp. TaxID=1898956 RepID=UPI0025D7F776|nr:hypothetical protein [Ottowia sp.]MBK6616620.1 hypothetical protein [Ottowia sp.]
MRTVFVHAWYLPGSSAGFDWYRSQDAADAAYTQDVNDALKDPARKGETYCCYRFDVQVPLGLSDEAVTDRIDADLDELSESATKFWPANAKELSQEANATA